MDGEVQDRKEKVAVEGSGFYSMYYSVPKKDWAHALYSISSHSAKR